MRCHFLIGSSLKTFGYSRPCSTMGLHKKKQGSKSKKSKGKTSASKVANKRLNKLAKQGKLRKEANKRKRREKLALRGTSQNTNHEAHFSVKDTDETELPLQEDDISFYSTPGQTLDFASTIRDSIKQEKGSSKRKSSKRKKDEAESEEDYERLPRKLFAADSNKNMKMILPIKTKAGVVPQMVEEEEKDDDEDAEENCVNPDKEESPEQETDQPEAEPLPILSSVELYALRQQKLAERKTQIAMLAQDITENPEQNVKKLRQLVRMLQEKDPDVFVTVRKLVMVSLMEVFKDIVPGYHIRLPTEQEKNQRMKKETVTLLEHEEGLLKAYKEYLEFLEKTAKGRRKEDKKNKKNNMKQKEDIIIPDAAQQGLMELSVKCMCEMLTSHPHFNYTNNIIAVVVWYMNHKRSEVADTVCDTVRQLFKEDKAGEITLELTKSIGRMIKTKEFRVQPKVLDTFLSLRIKEVSYTSPVEKAEKKKNHLDKLSRREKKRKKHMLMLEKELAETKATADKKKRLKLHTETIQAVFLTYFRILKKATDSVLLPSVLEGLAKFAHLINVDFFDDLFSVFNDLIQSEELSYRESLHCVQTAFTILSGQGSALNIDPMKFYKHLYTNLFHVHAGCTCGDVPIILDCLDVMVNKRKRQVSQQRVLSFLKRLSTLILQQTPDGALGLLAAIRNFIVTYSYTDILFDNEAQGSGVFLPELDDPEHCNAHNTSLWELTYLQRHYHPAVRKYGNHISRGSPSSGEGQLPQELRRSPMSLFKDFTEEVIFSDKIPEKCKKSKHKVHINGLRQSDIGDKVLSVLAAVPDVPPYFSVKDS